jgi:hypothetical protein
LTKLTKSNLFKVYDSKPETPMDKTTRVVRQMVEDETEQRLAKISRLRNTRLEREENTPSEMTAKTARKTRPSRTVSK